MSTNVTGKKREVVEEFGKKIGVFEGKVIAINPDADFYKNVLGAELKEDSKALEYLGTSKDNNTTLRVDVWLEEVTTKDKLRVTFFLEDKERWNKDGTKKQFINNAGSLSWGADENALPDWFKAREFRVAYSGEEELYNFIRTWLGTLDTRSDGSVLEFDWKKLMKGNVNDLRAQLNGEYCTNVGALATVRTVIKEDETKEYQGVYNKAFMPVYALKQFSLVDYDNPDIIKKVLDKKKGLKAHERFVASVYGEYGCKDFFKLKKYQDYNPEENVVSTDKVITKEGADY